MLNPTPPSFGTPRNPTGAKRLREQIRSLEERLAAAQAPQPPTRHVLSRPTSPYDWSCNLCGHLNYAGRQLCHQFACVGRRAHGTTIVGVIRGQHQNCEATRAAVLQQTRATHAPPNGARAQRTQTAQGATRAAQSITDAGGHAASSAPRHPSYAAALATPPPPVAPIYQPPPTATLAHRPGRAAVPTAVAAERRPQQYQQIRQVGPQFSANEIAAATPATLTANDARDSAAQDADGVPAGQDQGDDNATEAETFNELSIEALRKRLNTQVFKKAKRDKRLEKQIAAVQTQRELIEKEEKWLAELETVVDDSKHQIGEISRLVHSISARITELSAAQVTAAGSATPSLVRQSVPVPQAPGPSLLSGQVQQASEATLALLQANSAGQVIDGNTITKHLSDMLHLMQAMAASLPAATDLSASSTQSAGPVQLSPQDPPSVPAPFTLPPGPDSLVGPPTKLAPPQPSPVDLPAPPPVAATAIVEYRISSSSPVHKDGGAPSFGGQGNMEVDGGRPGEKRKLEDVLPADAAQEQVVTCVRKDPEPSLPKAGFRSEISTGRTELLQHLAKINEERRPRPISVPAPTQARRGRSRTPLKR